MPGPSLSIDPDVVDQEPRGKAASSMPLLTTPAPADREIQDEVLRLVERPHRVAARLLREREIPLAVDEDLDLRRRSTTVE